MWPGTLIYMADMIPHASVAIYALLAAGGDLGGSVAPQLVGSITDFVSQNGLFASFAGSLTFEQIGFKVGMLIASLFPLLGTVVTLFMRRAEKKEKSKVRPF